MERCSLALIVLLAAVVHASGLSWESAPVSALGLGAEDVEALRSGMFTETNVDWVKKISEGTDGLECTLECNTHPAEDSCRGLAETKCVGIFEGDNATVYVKHDYYCAGEFHAGYEESKESFTVTVDCKGARIGKTIIAIAPSDGGAEDEGGHPEFSAVVKYGYECGLKHFWSMEAPSSKGSGVETETTKCSGAESFQMYFFGDKDEEAWTTDDIDALAKEGPLPTSADAANTIIADVIEAAKGEVPLVSSEKATVPDLQEPEKTATCNDEDASFIGVCQGVFAFSITSDKFSMDGTCEGIHFGGFHESICSGKAASASEREESKRTEFTTSSCVGKETFKIIHGHHHHYQGQGHGFTVSCLGEAESVTKRVPKSEPSASLTSGFPRKISSV